MASGISDYSYLDHQYNLGKQNFRKTQNMDSSLEFNPAAGTGKLKPMKDTKREDSKI